MDIVAGCHSLKPWRMTKVSSVIANDQLGLEAAQTHGIDYQTAIPETLWRNDKGPLGEFIAREWEPWRQEVREKVGDLIELDAWLRRLKNNPPSP